MKLLSCKNCDPTQQGLSEICENDCFHAISLEYFEVLPKQSFN